MIAEPVSRNEVVMRAADDIGSNEMARTSDFPRHWESHSTGSKTVFSTKFVRQDKWHD